MDNQASNQDGNFQALHATVSGRVHGVGYRVFVLDAARRFKLRGWVRNTPDGSVEVHAVGERPRLDQLLTLLRQGPPAAQVKNVDFYWSNVATQDVPARFEVLN